MIATLTPPDRLTIKVTVQNNQTVSRFAVTAGCRVTFQNQGNEELTLLFRNEEKKEESPFCKGKDNPECNPVRIPRGDTKTLVVCENMAGRWFKYEATIGKADAEDPIFIIE